MVEVSNLTGPLLLLFLINRKTPSAFQKDSTGTPSGTIPVKMTPTWTGVGLDINHFVNIVTNVFNSNLYPVPVESLGLPSDS